MQIVGIYQNVSLLVLFSLRMRRHQYSLTTKIHPSTLCTSFIKEQSSKEKKKKAIYSYLCFKDAAKPEATKLKHANLIYIPTDSL